MAYKKKNLGLNKNCIQNILLKNNIILLNCIIIYEMYNILYSLL